MLRRTTDEPVPLLTALLLVGLTGGAVPFVDTHNQQAHAPDSMLDERQRAERDRVYVRAHQIIVGTLFLVFLYCLPMQVLGWWFPEMEGIVDLIAAFGIASMGLPGMILAWRARETEID